MARRLLRSLFCLILAGVGSPPGALAAELGDARVVSHIGQPLVADIELTALHDDTTPVVVRLASADVYRGAGIAMPPVLSGLGLSVTRRGGRQFLHVTSAGPVQSDYLHLYLELADGKERAVRLATLWLTPDPNPAPPVVARPEQPAAAPEPKLVPKAVEKAVEKAVPEAVAKVVPVRGGALAPEPAQLSTSAPGPNSGSQRLPVLVPDAGSKAKPKSAPSSAAPAPQARTGQGPQRAPVTGAAAPLATVASPVVLAPPLRSAAQPAASASCARPDPAVLRTCVALDYKNAQLTAQIGQLEDKVKVLQLAMGAAPARSSPQAVQPTPPVVVAKPKQAAPPPEPAFPWLWLALGGAVLLAGAGLSVVVILRRKAEQERKAKAQKAALPPVMAEVKNRLMPANTAQE